MAGVTQVSKYIKPLHWYSLGEAGEQGQREYSGDAAGGKHEQRKYSGDAAGGKRPAEVRNRRVLQLLGNIINNNTPYTHRHVCRIIPVIPFLPHFPI